MGGDEAVVAAARVSNGAVYENASKGVDADAKLIRFLLKHGHTSPFEHSVFTFWIKAPIFVQREWMRHRTWSYNEISGRYIEYSQEFYIPSQFRGPHPTNRQSSVDFDDAYLNGEAHITVDAASAAAWYRYQQLLSLGVSKEMARMVLPVNLYTQFYGTVNAHNLMHFLRLRNSEEAQWEIQEYAKAIEQIFSEKMPVTYGAWNAR